MGLKRKLLFLFLFLINTWIFPAWASSYHVVEQGASLGHISPLPDTIEKLWKLNLLEKSTLRIRAEN